MSRKPSNQMSTKSSEISRRPVNDKFRKTRECRPEKVEMESRQVRRVKRNILSAPWRDYCPEKFGFRQETAPTESRASRNGGDAKSLSLFYRVDKRSPRDRPKGHCCFTCHTRPSTWCYLNTTTTTININPYLKYQTNRLEGYRTVTRHWWSVRHHRDPDIHTHTHTHTEIRREWS